MTLDLAIIVCDITVCLRLEFGVPENHGTWFWDPKPQIPQIKLRDGIQFRLRNSYPNLGYGLSDLAALLRPHDLNANYLANKGVEYGDGGWVLRISDWRQVSHSNASASRTFFYDDHVLIIKFSAVFSCECPRRPGIWRRCLGSFLPPITEPKPTYIT